MSDVVMYDIPLCSSKKIEVFLDPKETKEFFDILIEHKKITLLEENLNGERRELEINIEPKNLRLICEQLPPK